MSNVKDISFGLGEDWRLTVRCYKADGITKMDLTGASASFGIQSKDLAYTANSPSGIVILTEPDASAPYRVYVDITAAMQLAASLKPGEYDYTVRITLANGTKDDPLYGVLHVRDTSIT